MFGYFCIGFIKFMLKSKSWIIPIYYPSEYEKNNKVILKYFQKGWDEEKCCIICGKI